MPFMDGYEATKQMRLLWENLGMGRTQQPKIYAITGHIEQIYLLKAKESGMDQVYSKPLAIKLLGDLLLKMKFIENVAEHLKLD
jgi:CheY-like chemotaxis protein